MNTDTIKLKDLIRNNSIEINGLQPIVLLAFLSLENIRRVRALCASTSSSTNIIHTMARHHPLLTSYVAAANLECRPNRRILPSHRGRLVNNCLRVSPAILQPFPSITNKRNKTKRDSKSIFIRKNNYSEGVKHVKDEINYTKTNSILEKKISKEQAIELANMSAKINPPALEELLEEVREQSEKRFNSNKFLKNVKTIAENEQSQLINSTSITTQDSIIFPQKPVLARSSLFRTPSLLKVNHVLRTWTNIAGKQIKKRWNLTPSNNSLPLNLENMNKNYLSDSTDSINSCSIIKANEARGDNQILKKTTSKKSILKKCTYKNSLDTDLSNNLNSNNNSIIGSGDVEPGQEYIFEQKLGNSRRFPRGKKVQWNPNAEVFYYADSKLPLLRRSSIPLREVTIPSSERYKNSICLDLHVPISL